VRIGTREIALDRPPYVIAEIGVNHDGSADRAMELVRCAKRAHADAVKLQLFQTDLLLSKAAKLAAYQAQTHARDPFELLCSLELSIDEVQPIVDGAHELGLHAIVTVFSVELVEPAAQLEWDAFKTASPDIINRPLVEALMRTNRPLVVSAGASTMQEIQQVEEWLEDYPHLIMQCVSAYPAPDDQAALAGRAAMQEITPVALGYSDHTTAIDTGALAVASGARVLEKHITHNRAAAGPDHAASLDPEAFAEYVRLAHRAFVMMGQRHKGVLDIEQDVRAVARQSIVARRNLKAGEIARREHLTIKRPGTGLAPFRIDEVIGRTLAHDVQADMPLQECDLL
jgi:N,N'-diacetyllegionaminate synthase